MLLAVEVEQATAEIASRRRQQFQARLGERTASILGPNFWTEVRQDLPQDAARLSAPWRQRGEVRRTRGTRLDKFYL